MSVEEWKDTHEIQKTEVAKQVSLSHFFPNGTRLDQFV